jgi:hypothetical protein
VRTRHIGLEELRDIPLAILKRHPNIPVTYLRRIGAKPEIYAICPIQVQRQIWQVSLRALLLFFFLLSLDRSMPPLSFTDTPNRDCHDDDHHHHQIDEELFKGRVFPLLNQYINTELDAPINEMLISTDDLIEPRRRLA